MDKQEFQQIRQRLNRTQKDLAELLGVSLKAVESYEQGWRHVPANIERLLYYLLFRISRPRGKKGPPCWNFKHCEPAARANCPAWISREGRYCWFISGRICAAGKPGGCFCCDFFTAALAELTPPARDRKKRPE
jgi:hypothetical protein